MENVTEREQKDRRNFGWYLKDLCNQMLNALT